MTLLKREFSPDALPILNEDYRSNQGNYRPSSITTHVKNFEKILYKQA